MQYIARKRARFHALSGDDVNLPYGTLVERNGNILFHNGKPLCYIKSHSAHEFFSPNDDGNGPERGNLIEKILKRLKKRDEHYQDRWDKIWTDNIAQKYKRPEHKDFWLWNHEFYCAPIFDLQYIYGLIGGV